MPSNRLGVMGAAGAGGGGINSLFLWGSAANGTQGNGTTSPDISTPTLLSVSSWIDIRPIAVATAAIKSDGTLWTWGYAGLGRLANNSSSGNISSPVQVGDSTDWAMFSSGDNGTRYSWCHAIKTDGTLWAWGENTNGQLGDGTVENRSSPVQIGALTDWTNAKISSYYKHTHAVKADGTLWGWGYTGTRGGIGDGTSVNKSSPVQIGALTTWTDVSTRRNGAMALKNDGTIWSWGRNIFDGEVGDNTKIGRSSPVQIGTDWAALGCVNTQNLAVKTDGTMWAWGYSQWGLGVSGLATTKFSSPIQVGSLTDWSKVYVGGGTPHMKKTNGTLWGFGQNSLGLIGDETTIDKSSPVQVGVDTDWTTIRTSLGTGSALKIPS